MGAPQGSARAKNVRGWARRGILAALLSLGRARNWDCEDAFRETALAVDGVVSAEFDCSDMFGGGWQRGKVVLRDSSRDEAIRVMDALLQAFAAEPRLEPQWSTPQQYRNEDGSIVIGAGTAGFPAVPTIREVRARYGIAPGKD